MSSSAFIIACKSGNLEMVKYLLDKYTHEINDGLETACYEGHLEIVKYLVEHGADNFNDGLCSTGHLKIAEYLVECGANDFNKALHNACLMGRLDIAKYLVKCGANNFNDGSCSACYGDQLDTVKYMIECGANNFDDGLAATASVEIVKFLIEETGAEFKVDHLNTILEHACNNYYLYIIKYILERGANKLELIPWDYTQPLLDIGTDYKLLDSRSVARHIYDKNKRNTAADRKSTRLNSSHT